LSSSTIVSGLVGGVGEVGGLVRFVSPIKTGGRFVGVVEGFASGVVESTEGVGDGLMRGREGFVVCAKALKVNKLTHNKTKKIFLIFRISKRNGILSGRENASF
jgi:hypothetical protein